MWGQVRLPVAPCLRSWRREAVLLCSADPFEPAPSLQCWAEPRARGHGRGQGLAFRRPPLWSPIPEWSPPDGPSCFACGACDATHSALGSSPNPACLRALVRAPPSRARSRWPGLENAPPCAALDFQGGKFAGEAQGTARANMDTVMKGWFSEVSPMWPGARAARGPAASAHLPQCLRVWHRPLPSARSPWRAGIAVVALPFVHSVGPGGA